MGSTECDVSHQEAYSSKEQATSTSLLKWLLETQQPDEPPKELAPPVPQWGPEAQRLQRKSQQARKTMTTCLDR